MEVEKIDNLLDKVVKKTKTPSKVPTPDNIVDSIVKDKY